MAQKISQEAAESLGVKKPSSDTAGGLPPEDGLEVLGPDPEELQTSQGPVMIGPMKMRQIKVFITHAKKFMPLLQEQMKLGEVSLTSLMAVDSDEFDLALAAACDKPLKWLRELTADEYIRVTTKVLVVNTDFFVRTLPLALGGAELSIMNAVVRLVQGGLGPSNVSSGTATA